ncbi:N-acetylglucosamine-1-phosphate uridyltransferase [Halobacteriales archaeon QH_8_64_26]|nr:MAG: N-acetylglucosamine-1-phosphate uridyltransferase [Halobacteriales archaeon QH_8_64_26]
MRRVGFVLNPIAGMGGRVGLKGTDGQVEAARERGATPRAPDRAREALATLRDRASEPLELSAYDDPMGATEAREAGFEPVIVGHPEGEETTAADTRAAVEALLAEGVDLLVFVGGDGTAVDVAEALAAENADLPVLGVPAGVKVYSAVFAVSPAAAGRIAADFDSTERREVSDLDEDAYRAGEVRSELRGVVSVPVAAELQSSKQLAGGTVETLAAGFASEVDPEVTYVFGPGGTVGTVEEALDVDGSPLGVDVWRDGNVLALDAAEAEISERLGERNVVVVSPIGGQGFVFGRGNDQLSPAVLNRSEIEIVASRPKLDDIGVLRVDTGDRDTDEALRGWHRVRVGRFEHRLVQVV